MIRTRPRDTQHGWYVDFTIGEQTFQTKMFRSPDSKGKAERYAKELEEALQKLSIQ